MFGSSQTLGLGATQGMSQIQSSPEKSGKKEDRQTCVPTSVRLLLDSHKAAERDGGELQLHGSEAVNITLVGVVEAIVQQATMVEFTLNDGSGRLKVRHYKNESSGETALASGQYVSLVGSIRTAPEVHVSAMTLRPVSSADEVSYHMIDVAHTALTMKSGTGAAFVKTAPPVQVAVPQPMTTAAAPGLALAAPPAAVAPAAVPPTTNSGDAQKSVLEVLQSLAETRPGGVPLAVLIESLKSLTAAAVKAALEQLVVDGEAFTTIDDDHFSPL